MYVYMCRYVYVCVMCMYICMWGYYKGRKEIMKKEKGFREVRWKIEYRIIYNIKVERILVREARENDSLERSFLVGFYIYIY